MFEKASRLKLRFDTVQGKVSVEDLWDLPLTTKSANRTSLDDIAKAVNRQLKTVGEEESFVLKTTPGNTIDKLKLEILKHVISVKLTENDEAEKSAANRAKKQQILELINLKQNTALGEKSIEELTAMVSAL